MSARPLPGWVREWGESLDAARELLRRRPDLAGLAQYVGSLRVFTPEAAEQIRTALAGRRRLVPAR
ncbi:MAG TPA: hypothetical protein VKE74_20840 [Gemmataceae bacterium]|nr:hypothetical protein [Gemmataceae bacterium]